MGFTAAVPSQIDPYEAEPSEADVASPAAPVSVCMLTNLYPPVVSGSSTHCLQLGRSLASTGMTVVIVTAHVDEDTPEYEQVDGVHIYRLPVLRLPKHAIALNFPWLNSMYNPGNTRRLREIIRRHGSQVLHLHNHMFDSALLGMHVAKSEKLPTVLTMHTVIKHANPLYNAVLYPFDRYLLKHAVVKRATRVISPDGNMARYVAERFRRPGSDLITYGLDEPTPPDPALVESLRAKHKLHGCQVILSIGHVHVIRDRLDLVRALPHIRKEVPNVRLMVVGGVFSDAAERTAKELGVSEHLVFAGAQPQATISSYLALGDIEAHWLNQQKEVTWASPGIASMEAMVNGKAVFAVAPKDIFGVGVLEDDGNVVLVQDPTDAPELARRLVELLKNPARARAIGEKARDTCRDNFTWERVADKTIGLYRSLVPVQSACAQP